MPGFKDILNLIVWQMFIGNGYSQDAVVNQIQFAICMVTAGPFIS